MTTKKSKALILFNAPGLGDNLKMDEQGRVYILSEEGKPRECIAYRDQEGVWQIVRSFKIINPQLVETLETLFQSA